MMPFVVDASIATAWVVADEQNAEADRLSEQARLEGAHVPDLFWHEILATVDKALAVAARACDVALLGPLAQPAP